MRRPRHLLTILGPLLALHSPTALALPIEDATLGTQPVLTGPNSVRIDGGTAQGQNLFHSFESFSVAADESVYFFSPAEINHIFSRVTGSDRSTIDGVLGTFGSDADLFFMNPNGIVFGPSASLDVQGSFMATTADAIGLGEDGLFSATVPGSDRLLAIAPSAFFFSGLTPSGAIENQSQISRTSSINPTFTTVGLQVPNGEALLLLGGEIIFNSGQLKALGGRIELGAVAGRGEVGFAAENNALSLPDTIMRDNITLGNGSQIGTIFSDGGDIFAYANNFSASNSTGILAGIGLGLGGVDSRGGDIRIDATGIVTVSDSSAIGGGILGTGTGGDINVSAQDIMLVNGSQISTIGVGLGNVGNVTLRADKTIAAFGRNPSGTASGVLASFASLAGFSGQGNSGNIELLAEDINLADGAVVSSSVLLGIGNSGNIDVAADNLSLNRGSQIATSTFGTGAAGAVTIDVTDRAVFDGTTPDGLSISGVFSTVNTGALGAGGDVKLSANSLEVINGAVLNASTSGMGDAGDVVIDVRDRAVFDGATPNGQSVSGIFSTVNAGAQGTGGNVNLFANSLELTNGAVLNASTVSRGDAGDVVIDVRDRVVFDGTTLDGQFSSGAFSVVNTGANGNGGNVQLSANSLEVTNGAVVNASTSGVGNAGDIVIDVRDRAVFNGVTPNGQSRSGAFSIVNLGAQGNGGSVRLSANSFEVTDGAALIASTFDRGDAGDVVIEVRDSVAFDGASPDGQLVTGAFSTVEANARGEGGSVNLSANSLELTNGAVLNASTVSRGDAGDVVIDVRDRVVFDGTTLDGQFSSGAFSVVNTGANGNGGNVQLSANSLEVTNGAAVNASTSGVGNAGDIVIDVRDRAIFKGLTPNGQFTSGAFSQVESGATGNGGNLQIFADSVSVLEGARLQSITVGDGNAGNITLDAKRSVTIEGVSQRGDFISSPSGILTVNGNSLDETGTGRSGNVTVTASLLSLKDGSFISARTLNNQLAGNINLEVDSLVLLRGGQIVISQQQQRRGRYD